MSITAGSVARADDFINASQANATPSNDAGRVPKLETTGRVASRYTMPFGDGSDGNVTISSPTTLTRDMYYNDLVVNDVLTTNGWRIFVAGTISGTGTVRNNGTNGSPGASPAGGAGGAVHTGYFTNTAGAIGSTAPDNNANGGVNGTSPANGLCVNPAGNGGKGARGDAGAGASPNGGTGGTATAPAIAIGKLAFNTIEGLLWTGGALAQYKTGGSGGSGGGGGDTDAGNTAGGGGGGGASGGFILIVAKIWAGTFTIEAKGGNGGAGGNASVANAGGGGGGGGGTGGYILVVYDTKTWTGSHVVTGGALGAAGTSLGTAPNDATAGTAGGNGVSQEIPMSSILL